MAAVTASHNRIIAPARSIQVASALSEEQGPGAAKPALPPYGTFHL